MSPAGRQVVNPVTGETITFLETAADTNGERFRMDIRIEAGRSGMAGPVHFHPHQVETFHVLAGKPLFSMDGDASTAAAGDVVTIPRGVPHIFGNAGPDELHMISEYRPRAAVDGDVLRGVLRARQGDRQGPPRPAADRADDARVPRLGSFASLSASFNPRRNGAFGLPSLPLASFLVGVARNWSMR